MPAQDIPILQPSPPRQEPPPIPIPPVQVPPPLPPAPGRTRAKALGGALPLYITLMAFSAVAILLRQTGALSDTAAILFLDVSFSVVVLVWLIKEFGRVRPSLAGLGKLWWSPLGVVLGGITFAVAMVLVKSFIALGIPEIRLSEMFREAGYGWTTVFLLMCVQPAIFEELAFRGVILGALQDVMTPREAVLVSALMFMLLHLAPVNFPHLLLMGLALGYVRVRSGSLYPCMLMHLTHNLLVVLTEMKGL